MPGKYRIYKRSTPDGGDSLLAEVAAPAATTDLSGFVANEVAFLHIKAVTSGGVEDIERVRLRRVAFDGSANFVAPVPNAPTPGSLTLTAQAAGMVEAAWRYTTADQAVAPGSFKVFVALDAGFPGTEFPGAFNFASPAATVAYGQRQAFRATLGPYSDGQLVSVVVRAVSGDGDSEANMAIASIRAKVAAPTAPQGVTFSTTAE